MEKLRALPGGGSSRLRQEARFLARLASQIEELQHLYRERSLLLADQIVQRSGLAAELEPVDAGDDLIHLRLKGI